jgi:prophage DNA circulation protein
MAYDTRIRKAEYQSPSGESFVLYFDDVERSGAKKAAIHEYPQQDKADVQDLGNSAERFPFNCYFTGSDFDKMSDKFWNALSEKITPKKPAKFKHPRYGDINVMPLSWMQSEKLVEGLGRSDFKIEFIRVGEKVLFPLTVKSVANKVQESNLKLKADLLNKTLDNFNPTDSLDILKIKEQQKEWKQSFKSNLSKILAVSDMIYSEAERTLTAIEDKIDEIESAPKEFFQDCIDVYGYVQDAAGDIGNKINKLKDHVLDIYDKFVDIVNTEAQVIAFLCDVGAAISCAFGCSSSVSTAETTTATGETVPAIQNRIEAIGIAETFEEIRDLYIEIIEYFESEIEGFHEDPEIISMIFESFGVIIQNLIQYSFELRAEKKMILNSERTPIDLCYEVYGTIDNLEDFINQNNLIGDEILLIPSGREVVYYG